MNKNDKPNALAEDTLEQVAGGRAPDPVGPHEPSTPTESWSEASNKPVEIGGGAAGCPQPGCNETALVWDGNSDVNTGSKTEFCYRFHCENCKTYYAKSVSTNKWYIKG